MSKRLKDLGTSVDLKFDTEKIKAQANEILNANSAERKIFMRYKILKTAATVAALTAALATSVFAMTPAGQEAINSIVAYFQNANATEMTSIEELAKYNEEIGASCTKDGYTLTLDNVAADDNFIHVFYTVKAENAPFYEGDDPKTAIYSDAVNEQMDTQCVINGSPVGRDSNHNTHDGYFADNYTYKAAEKYNVFGKEIPDSFTVELFGAIVEKDGYIIDSPLFDKLYQGKYAEITDEDKVAGWYVSAEVDKSKVKTESVTREINLELPWVGATVEKVIFSPFGNQLVVTTPAGSDAGHIVDSHIALTDENGIFLDILNTDIRENADGSSVNSYEFLKADKDTKQLNFIPIYYDEKTRDSDVIERPLGQYPITFEINEYGNIVVTAVRFGDGLVEIDYYKDGFYLYDPALLLLDSEGNNAEPGGKIGCVRYIDVHYDTNSYTARYVYDNYDENGNPIPMGDDVKADALRQRITTLGEFANPFYTLDFDNAVTVDLK